MYTRNFVFEDLRESYTAKLYLISYNEDLKQRIKYSSGNGNLLNTSIELLNESVKNTVCVFIDMVPGNIIAWGKYRDLANLNKSERYRDRIIVFLVICSEYYIIKSLKNNKWMFTDYEAVKLCVNRQPYTDNNGISEKVGISTNFEKFCKNILKHVAIDCLKRLNISNDNGRYYCGNCPCKNQNYNVGIQKILDEKSLEYVKSWECYPMLKWVCDESHKLTDVEEWKLHRRLVDRYNEMTNLFEKEDVRSQDERNKHAVKYKYIEAMK